MMPVESNHNDELARFWDSIFAESTAEKVTVRRREVKQLLERIRAGTKNRTICNG